MTETHSRCIWERLLSRSFRTSLRYDAAAPSLIIHFAIRRNAHLEDAQAARLSAGPCKTGRHWLDAPHAQVLTYRVATMDSNPNKIAIIERCCNVSDAAF